MSSLCHQQVGNYFIPIKLSILFWNSFEKIITKWDINSYFKRLLQIVTNIYRKMRQVLKRTLGIIKCKKSLLRRAIYKTRNTGTGNGMRGMRETWEMFTWIPGNLLEDSGECYHFNIPGNVPEDSGECWRRFREIFNRVPGNVREDLGECSRRFRGMLAKILENTQKDWMLYNAIKRK